jgi:hypothetical protein
LPARGEDPLIRLPFYYGVYLFSPCRESPSLKTQKRAVARFLMLQVDLLDLQRERLSVHAINHKEKLKFIPQYTTSTTPNHDFKRIRRT